VNLRNSKHASALSALVRGEKRGKEGGTSTLDALLEGEKEEEKWGAGTDNSATPAVGKK